MRQKFPVGLILLLAVGFVGFGDQVLPRPIGQYSLQARMVIDQAMIQMFPRWQSKTNPHARTEDAIQKMEQRK